MPEQPQSRRRQIVLKRAGGVEEVHARNGAIDDLCAEGEEFEVVVVKREVEEAIQERPGEYHERSSPDDPPSRCHADDDSSG
jgi:hypothetical protein